MADILDRNTRSAFSGRLLRAAQKGYDPTAMAPAITVSNGGNTSLLTGLGYNSGLLLKTAANAYPLGGGFKQTGSANTLYHNGGCSFITDAPAFEVWIRGGRWEIYIDGKPSPGNPYVSPGDGYKLVDFGSEGQRHVELRFNRTLPDISGVAVRKPYTIYAAPPQHCPKVAVMGDSITDAIGSGDLLNPSEGWAMKLGRLCNWDTWALGEGGTGYTAPTVFLDRIANIPLDAEMVITAGGINDNGAVPATLQAAVTTYVQAVRARCPNALHVVMGPWRAPGRTPSQAISDAVKNGHLAASDSRTTFVDTYAENWQNGADNGIASYKQSGVVTFTGVLSAATSGTLTAAWGGATASYTIVFDTGATKTVTLTNGSASVSWSGAITAGAAAYVYTAASGNSGIYLPNDTIHPGVVGHTYLAYRVRNALTTWLRTLV